MGAALVGEIMRLIHTLLVAGAVAVFGGAASASTLKIDFDGASGDGGTVINESGDKRYEVGGYIMEPVNLQGGLCADGKCTIESTQTIEPTLYREDFTSYDLYSFYFLNTGNGAGSDNFVELAIYSDYGDESPSAPVLTFGNGDSLFKYAVDGISITYFDGEGSDPGSVAECFTDIICKNYGYVIDLGDWATGIGKAIWSAEGDANARLDDIVVNPIPLPAAGWLLIAGLGGLAAMKRRKAA